MLVPVCDGVISAVGATIECSGTWGMVDMPAARLSPEDFQQLSGEIIFLFVVAYGVKLLRQQFELKAGRGEN